MSLIKVIGAILATIMVYYLAVGSFLLVLDERKRRKNEQRRRQ